MPEPFGKTMAINYFRNADGVLLVFDVTDIESLNETNYWRKLVLNECSADPVVILVGNKIDRESDRKVTTEQGKEMAVAYDIDYMETSAADGTGVNEVFNKLAEKIYCQKFESLDEPIKLHQPQTRQRNKCKT